MMHEEEGKKDLERFQLDSLAGMAPEANWGSTGPSASTSMAGGSFLGVHHGEMLARE